MWVPILCFQWLQETDQAPHTQPEWPHFSGGTRLIWGFPDGANGKEFPWQCRRHRDTDLIPVLGRSLGEEMATHSSILAWKIPWTEGPGGLQFMELEHVRFAHDSRVDNGQSQ